MSLSIAIIGSKGGVGKSTIALNLARNLNATILSNDKISKLDLLCKKDECFIMDKLEFINSEKNIIYDFGGFPDKTMIEIAKKVNVVIFVTTYEILSNSQIIEYINDLKKFNSNNFLIANKLGVNKNYKYSKNEIIENEFKEILEEIGKKHKIETLKLRYSNKIFEAFNQGLSLNEAIKKYKFKNPWKEELMQLEMIIKRIKS